MKFNKEEESLVILDDHADDLIQKGYFTPFIWKNSYFIVTNRGNIYRLRHKGKFESIKDFFKT